MSCDCERPSAWTRKERKARVRHRCCECDRFIEPGARYEYCSGVWDGRAFSYHTCIACSDARDLLTQWAESNHACDCIEMGGLVNAALEVSLYIGSSRTLLQSSWLDEAGDAAARGWLGGLMYELRLREDGCEQRLAEWRAKKRLNATEADATTP